MVQFIMRWPELNRSVRCEGIHENEKALEVFLENLPIRTVQGHEMVGGWMIRNRSVLMEKKFFDVPASELKQESMKDAPIGRISLLFPQGIMTEMLIKYDECKDVRQYVPVAKVVDEDLQTLNEVGKLQWKSATRTKEIYTVEFIREEK